MKRIITIVALFALLLSFASCDKYHRDRYTGNWDFVAKRVFYKDRKKPFQIEVSRDTVYYSGKISLGSHERELFIHYTEDEKIRAWIGEKDEKNLIFSDEVAFWGKYSCGEFISKDKLRLSLQFLNNNLPIDIPYDHRYEYIVGIKKGRK